MLFIQNYKYTKYINKPLYSRAKPLYSRAKPFIQSGKALIKSHQQSVFYYPVQRQHNYQQSLYPPPG
jgi:hypothetical protein